MKSKVTFVSGVGAHLLTSFWIHLWFSLRSSSYCLTLGGAWWGIKPAEPFFAGLLGSCTWWGVGVCFPFPMVPQGWGLSLGYSNHRCPVCSPHYQSTCCPDSILHSCALGWSQ